MTQLEAHELQLDKGSVVLVKEPAQPSADVIGRSAAPNNADDLIALLRDLASNEEVTRNLGLMIQEAGSKMKSLEAKPRLTLRERDAPFFQKYVQEVLAKTPGVQYQYKLITVKYVLPQNPKNKSKWLKEFSDNQRAEWTHRIANLVLLNRTKNSEAQNYEFDVKKLKYFSGKNGVATFALTSQVLGITKWNPKTLEARQQELLSAMSNEWNLGTLP